MGEREGEGRGGGKREGEGVRGQERREPGSMFFVELVLQLSLALPFNGVSVISHDKNDSLRTENDDDNNSNNSRDDDNVCVFVY